MSDIKFIRDSKNVPICNSVEGDWCDGHPEHPCDHSTGFICYPAIVLLAAGALGVLNSIPRTSESRQAFGTLQQIFGQSHKPPPPMPSPANKHREGRNP